MILKRVVYFIQLGKGCRRKAMEYTMVLKALGSKDGVVRLALEYQQVKINNSSP